MTKNKSDPWISVIIKYFDSNKTEPCPYCGGRVEVEITRVKRTSYFLVCHDCGKWAHFDGALVEEYTGIRTGDIVFLNSGQTGVVDESDGTEYLVEINNCDDVILVSKDDIIGTQNQLDSIIQKIGYDPRYENPDAGLDDQLPYITRFDITEDDLKFLSQYFFVFPSLNGNLKRGDE